MADSKTMDAFGVPIKSLGFSELPKAKGEDRAFSTLSGVLPERVETWKPIYLTFDFDWAEDAVIHDAIDLVERAGVEATWFVTHRTPAISRLTRNPRFEVGIHPNFNNLFAGDFSNGRDFKEVIGRLMEISPDAKCLRSHSLTTSSKVLQAMPEFGLTHESNLYIPPESGMTCRPFRAWNGVIRVPHLFEDDLFLCSGPIDACNSHIKTIPGKDGVKVLDFHPIHTYLNSESMGRYETTRHIHRNIKELAHSRYQGEGIRTALETLLGLR